MVLSLLTLEPYTEYNADNRYATITFMHTLKVLIV